MAPAASRVTLVHVAKHAGVALSTASHAFSSDKPISEATRARVLAAAASLGYHGPDPLASSLRSGRTSIIGVQVDDDAARAFRDPVIIGILDGVTNAVAGRGMSVLLIPHSIPTERLRTLPVDGVVAAGCLVELRQLRESMARRAIPVVTAGNQIDDLGCIGVENYSATALLTDHLRDLGHHKVGVVALPAGDVEAPRTHAAHSAFPDAVVVSTADSTIDEGIQAGNRLLEHRSPPTAVIAQSDLLAVGVIRAAEMRGLRVPEDLSVVGFDGIQVDGFGRSLTTIRQPIVEMGRLAAEAILGVLDDGDPLPSRAMPVEFIRGVTTAPPHRS